MGGRHRKPEPRHAVSSSYNAYLNGCYGNNALTYAPSYEPRPAVKPKTKRARQAEIKKRSTERNRRYYEFVRDKASETPLMNIVTIGIIALCSLLLLVTNAYSASLNSQLAEIQSQYEELSEDNKAARESLEKGLDLEMIKSIATSRLGMVVPGEHQKVYIDLPKQSYAVSYEPETIDAKEEPGIGGMFNLLSGMFGGFFK